MPIVPIDNLGSVGLIRDIWAPDTPPEAWSDMRNARMGPFGAEKFLGHEPCLASFTNHALHLLYVPVMGNVGWWLALGSSKAWARKAFTPYAESAVTRQTAGVDVNYTASAGDWQASLFGGIAIANNGFDVPQFWADAVTPGKLADLTNWPSTYRCANIKGFGRYLVAINLSISGTKSPQQVKWSHPSDFASVPSSWDYTDPTVDAGEYPLMDAVGGLVDQMGLRKLNMLYTTDQVWGMRYVGGNDIFGFDPVIQTQGALAQNCITKFKKAGEHHLVLGGDDIYIHNGQTAESILEPKMRRWFFSQIDAIAYPTSFVVANEQYSEVWVCVPQTGYTQPNIALVWNWLTNSISFRDLLMASDSQGERSSAADFGTFHIASGYMEDTTGLTWNSASGQTWDRSSLNWFSSLAAQPVTPRLLMADARYTRPYLLDSTNDFSGTAIPWFVERTGIAFSGVDRSGKPKSDGSTTKLLTEVWPRFDAPQGTEISVSIGVQDREDVPPTWYPAYTYTVGEDPFISVYHESRYFSIRFECEVDPAVRLLGYGLNIANSAVYA